VRKYNRSSNLQGIESIHLRYSVHTTSPLLIEVKYINDRILINVRGGEHTMRLVIQFLLTLNIHFQNNYV